MKGLSYISLIIAIIVIVNELAYLGDTSLAWVIIGLAVALGLNSLNLIKSQK